MRSRREFMKFLFAGGAGALVGDQAAAAQGPAGLVLNGKNHITVRNSGPVLIEEDGSGDIDID